jgi:hypothetical protein
MTTPFDSSAASIPVTVVTRRGAPVTAAPGVRLLRLERALHEHVPGTECPACAARGDVRAMLFDLLQTARAEQRPLTAVVVDATSLDDARPIVERLQSGLVPAFGLRVHTVLRSFHLARVV